MTKTKSSVFYVSEVAVIGCHHRRHLWLLVSTQQPTGCVCVGGGSLWRVGRVERANHKEHMEKQ